MKRNILTLIIFFIFLQNKNFAQVYNLDWVEHIGAGLTTCKSIAIDDSDNVYIIGNYDAVTDFDFSVSTTHTMATTFADFYLVKYNKNKQFVWSISLEPSFYIGGGITAKGIKLDSKGDILLYGWFNSIADFDPSPTQSYTLTPLKQLDGFVMKLDKNSNFKWAKQIAGVKTEIITGVCTDKYDNVYSVGTYVDTTDFNPTGNAFILNSKNKTNGFLSKYDKNGNFLNAYRIGGDSATAKVDGLEIDKEGNLYLIGSYTKDCYFFNPVNPTPNFLGYTSTSSMFICKVDSLQQLKLNFNINGGSTTLPSNCIKLDANKNIICSGNYYGTFDFDPSSDSLKIYGNNDIFLASYSPTGSLNWAKRIGSYNSTEVMNDFKISPNNSIYMVGNFSGNTDFDPSNNFYLVNSSNAPTTFIANYTSLGNFNWVKSYKSGNQIPSSFVTPTNSAQGIGFDSKQNIYVVGQYRESCSFYDAQSDYLLSSHGHTDAYIAKYYVSPIGLKEEVFNSDIEVYPVPTQESIKIKLGLNGENQLIKLEIFNLIGETMFKTFTNEILTEIDLSSFSNGIYVLGITTNTGSKISKKIIKN